MATPRKSTTTRKQATPAFPQVASQAIKTPGQHDQVALESVLTLLTENPEGVTVKQVAEHCNLRVRVLENTLWRLSDQGGKYNPPFLVRGKQGNLVKFTQWTDQEGGDK